MTEHHPPPVSGREVWTGTQLARSRRWEFALEPAQQTELIAALEHTKRDSLTVPEINAKNFPLPKLGETLRQIGAELQHGVGFALLRNFPVADHGLEDLEKMYWGLCSHIGGGVTQNSDGGLIHYVTDGALRPNQGTRGVGLPGHTPLHVDLTDVASLLCVRQAPDNPPSRVVSAAAVHNEILARHPEYLSRLYRGYEWDRMGEHGADETPTSGYLVPLFSESQGKLSCQYNRNWMESAARRNGKPFSETDVRMFDFLDELAQALCFEFAFESGDVQFCNNYTVMHGRAAHALVRDEQRKRLLLRIWMNIPNFRRFSDEAIVRYGIGFHGRLGWTAEQVRTQYAQPRRRRADGALASDSAERRPHGEY